MRGELNKVKSYLPQSVLVTLYGTGEDDDEEEASPLKAMRNEVESERLEHPDGPPQIGDTAVTSVRSGGSSARGGTSTRGGDKGVSPKVAALTGSERRSVHESDRQSTRSSARGIAAAPKLLNTATNVNVKRVTVAIFNLRGFHAFCGRSSGTEIATTHALALESISRHIAENKGVVDFFHGDHLQASFNAVSHCAAHVKRGAVAAIQVVREFSQHSNMLHATVGLSTGPAHVGNVGSSTMKRFCVIGPVVPQALLLERMTRLFPGSTVLCPSPMFHELNLELLLQCVGIVALPGGGKPKAIANIEGMKKMATDEWMYQLKEGETNDPYVHSNRFFEAAADGEVSEALGHVGVLSATPHEKPFISEGEVLRLADLLRDCASKSTAVEVSKLTTSCGPYYDQCVGVIA